jgi:hypothetical protein
MISAESHNLVRSGASFYFTATESVEHNSAYLKMERLL